MFNRNKNTPNIIEVDGKLISGEVMGELFACDLSKCKGACCVEGDLGAPLEKEELAILDDIAEAVEPYLREEGKQAIREQGNYVHDFTGDYSTPLVEGRECAYVTFSPDGIALCGIEQAWQDGKIDFQKPISCHLYPVRVSKSAYYDLLNYDQWDICAPPLVSGGERIKSKSMNL
jgi:hypothetical protein